MAPRHDVGGAAIQPPHAAAPNATFIGTQSALDITLTTQISVARGVPSVITSRPSLAIARTAHRDGDDGPTTAVADIAAAEAAVLPAADGGNSA
eukprot:gene38581-64346_t